MNAFQIMSQKSLETALSQCRAIKEWKEDIAPVCISLRSAGGRQSKPDTCTFVVGKTGRGLAFSRKVLPAFQEAAGVNELP